MSLFIDDGYTQTKRIAAVPGLHPECAVVYRPVLAAKRTEYALLVGTGNAEKVTAAENDLLVRQVVSLNGEPLVRRELAGRLIPDLRNKIVNLVLGYSPADEEGDAKNSPSGCE